GSTRPSGRLVALGINPVAPTGPVTAPEGNRRGSFAAGPNGRVGGAGTPGSPNSNANGKTGNGSNGTTTGLRGRSDSSLPSGLHVGASDSASRVGSSGSGHDGTRETASASAPRVGKTASPVSDDKVTDVDRQVFGGKRFYSMISNTPNLNSSTGSWVIRFAELQA